MQVKNMTEGKPIRLILGIALPLMLGNVFQQLYTVVDASVVGKGLGVSALAALGTSDWFNWLFLGAVQGMAQGFTIPMAQCFGAKDDEGLRKNVGNAIVLAVLGAALFTVAAILLIQPVLEILGSPVEIRPMASEYLRVLFAGLPVVMAYNLMAGILRAGRWKVAAVCDGGGLAGEHRAGFAVRAGVSLGRGGRSAGDGDRAGVLVPVLPVAASRA